MEQIDFGLSEIFGEGSSKLTATVTIKTDINGTVSIDGSDVSSVKSNEPFQLECGLGQHIIKVTSEKYPDISKEVIQEVETPGRTYLLVIDGLAPLVSKAEKGSKPGLFSSLFGGRSKDGKPSKGTLKLKSYCDSETGQLLKKLEPLDIESKIPKIREIADDGDMVAQYVLGMLLWKGVGCPVDAFAAHDYFQKSADQGYAFAMCSLAQMRSEPQAVFFDPDSAIKLAFQATKLGCKPAYLILGKAYDVVCNNQEALKWFETAAKNGSDVACEILGDKYLYGQDVPKDAEKALSWYEKGVLKGNHACMWKAGFRYAFGDGAPQNYLQALVMFQVPANNNDLNAQWGMGYCYCQQGNYQKAYYWLKKAAERGHNYAQYYLGTLLTQIHEGIPSDTKTAFYWLDKAALNGNQEAFKYVRRLLGLFEKYMSPSVRDQYKYGQQRKK